MKRDISESIKNNAHKLEQKPAPDLWNRLEQRLDTEQPKTKRFSFFKLGIAASVIGLIGVVAAISFMFKTSLNDKALAANHTVSFKVENIDEQALDDAEEGFYKVVAFQKSYRNRLSNPIIEGTGKKLSVAKAYRNISPRVINTKLATDINQFSWIIGEWSSKNKQKSMEKWRKSDDFTIEGAAYIMIDGKSTLNESMKIQQTGRELFFITDIDGSGKKVRYQLVTKRQNQLVFENSLITYPQQIVLTKTDDQQFSIYYQNIETHLPDANQDLFLQKRNQSLKGNKYARSLRKSN